MGIYSFMSQANIANIYSKLIDYKVKEKMDPFFVLALF